MKLIVLGLVMFVTSMGRERGRDRDEINAPADAGRSFASESQSQLMTTTVADVTGAVESDTVEVTVPDEQGGEDEPSSVRSPGLGDWRVACELKTGASLIFDRGSLRAVGSMTLVRWAAPGDPRASQTIYTALISCGEKTIEATWPGKRSDTRAGTCGRHLVESVCEAAEQGRGPARASSSRLHESE
jgi:hypothetical protein